MPKQINDSRKLDHETPSGYTGPIPPAGDEKAIMAAFAQGWRPNNWADTSGHIYNWDQMSEGSKKALALRWGRAEAKRVGGADTWGEFGKEVAPPFIAATIAGLAGGGGEGAGAGGAGGMGGNPWGDWGSSDSEGGGGGSIWDYLKQGLGFLGGQGGDFLDSLGGGNPLVGAGLIYLLKGALDDQAADRKSQRQFDTDRMGILTAGLGRAEEEYDSRSGMREQGQSSALDALTALGSFQPRNQMPQMPQMPGRPSIDQMGPSGSYNPTQVQGSLPGRPNIPTHQAPSFGPPSPLGPASGPTGQDMRDRGVSAMEALRALSPFLSHLGQQNTGMRNPGQYLYGMQGP